MNNIARASAHRIVEKPTLWLGQRTREGAIRMVRGQQILDYPEERKRTGATLLGKRCGGRGKEGRRRISNLGNRPSKDMNSMLKIAGHTGLCRKGAGSQMTRRRRNVP